MSGSGINGQPVDDQQILKRIAVGDRQALSELYVRYQRPLFNYLLQLTPDYGLAEELLQDTLIAVWKSARSFEGKLEVEQVGFVNGRMRGHMDLSQGPAFGPRGQIRVSPYSPRRHKRACAA